ncbi:DUF1444 family protein [Hellea balneolensis]|uniref:DUF1444 family protein n=1 Tax=Hellea balneolensis TaxID=287478 RepID=UPI00041448CA|nr:DUF1444 family protein [Hellea balneolensis]
MSLLSKLFGKKPGANSEIDIAGFRDLVIAKAKTMGSTSEFQTDVNDGGRLIILSSGEVVGEANMLNAFNHLKAYPEEDIDESVERIAAIILANENEDMSVAIEDVVIVLRPDNYINAVREQNGEVVAEVFVGELNEFYMVDTPQSMRGLTSTDVTELALADLREAALTNVKKWLPNLVSDKSINGMSLYYIEDNTFLTTSLVLLEEFWDIADAEYPNGCIFALPRKDQLFIFDINDVNVMQLATNMIKVTFEDDFNLLTSQIFSRRNGVIGLVEVD